MILDIYSRYTIASMVAERDTAGLAGNLVGETCLKHGVQPQVLTLHSDRGSPMTAKCTAQLLADLGVTQSLRRPRAANDNPFSEAHFKTVNYHPGFPGQFGCIEEAKDPCRKLLQSYNTEHRQNVLAEAYTARPDRFVRGPPKAVKIPTEVWINRALPVTVDGAEPTNGGKEGSIN